MSDKDSYVATANGAEGVRVNQYDAISGDIVRSDFIPHKEQTDKQKLEALLTGFKVEYKAKDHYDIAGDLSTSVTCSEGGEKVDGYCMFFTAFEFDKNGKFISMGAWE